MNLKQIFTEAIAPKPVAKPLPKQPLPRKAPPKEVNAITMDTPLFLRALEFAREDARADIDLHRFTENAEKLMEKSDILSMKDYKKLMKGVKTKKDEEEDE